jgi:hypothetical protein
MSPRRAASCKAGCIAAVIAVWTTACTTVENADVPMPAASLDEGVFRCNVEPILARQCSYNACHGNAGSPLRVYSPGKLRAISPQTIDDANAPLTEDEHHANFVSAAGFNYMITNVDDNWLLRKPLNAAQGGYEHEGGTIFHGGGDNQYGAIRAWLTGKGICPP